MSSLLKKGSERPILTSRDVYNFVAKCDQESLDKHDEYLDEYFKGEKEIGQNKLHCHDNETANDISVYSDGSFEDERDCEVKSVMTYHSDVVDDSRLHSSIESEEKRTNKDLLLSLQENVTKIDDIKENEIKSQNYNEERTDSPVEVAGRRDINTIVNEPESLPEEIRQDSLQDEVVIQGEKGDTVIIYQYEDKQISNDLRQRKTRIKSSRKAKGLPPRKTLVLLTTKGDPKKHEKKREMENAVKEILMRGENKIKELRVRAQNLRLDSEELRDENRALKKLQRLQGKEVSDMERFVLMTTTTARDIRKDVRDAEASSYNIDTSLRTKNKEIRQLQRECERYEKLIAMDHKMPDVSELEERIDLAEKNLQDKDKEIETLNKKVKIQEKKTIQVRQKEQRKFAQLEEDVHGTLQDCEELKQRLKEAERKINKTNIYSRRSKIHNALPAPPSLAALPWYPPVSRQTTSCKVKKWLNDSNNKH